jgi:hypothetical protein
LTVITRGDPVKSMICGNRELLMRRIGGNSPVADAAVREEWFRPNWC